MSGAAALAGRAALHGGAGLVTVAVPRCILHTVAAAHPSYMTLPLSDADGVLAASATAEILKAIRDRTVVALGPGLTRRAGVPEIVRAVYDGADCPLVLDADGLNAFVARTEMLRSTHPRVLTPHPGEFARLLGTDTRTVQSDRQTLATEFAAEHNVVLLLKGSATVITDGQQTAVNTTGNSGMATGGSGDVLTGLIASLLAQGMAPFDAAHCAAHLHGLAGDLAAEQLSEPYLTSDDLVHWLAPAWQHLEKRCQEPFSEPGT